MTLSLQPITVLIGTEAEEGYLVFADQHLAAVLVRLDASHYGPDRGRWNLEAGFGACDVKYPYPFPELAGALAWVADQVGAPAATVTDAILMLGNGMTRKCAP